MQQLKPHYSAILLFVLALQPGNRRLRKLLELHGAFTANRVASCVVGKSEKGEG